MIDIKFTIPLVPVSKKNSQQILVNRATGRPFIMPSKIYREYEKAAAWFIPKEETVRTPVNVECVFYMPTRRKCDLPNMEQAIFDIMVKYGLLEDDNYTIIQSHDGSRILYDKDRPRTEIHITDAAD